MSLAINHNITALNAWRQLSMTDRRMSSSMEKLSSGLRINRGADDPAGLVISEKMRAQLTSINSAIKNSEKAINLISTAEAALDKTNDYHFVYYNRVIKPALVGLAGYEDFYPSEISGGMQKRAGLARAMALDPDILFFDEPSAGLDPVSARRLDDLILELRDSLGATVVIVTHELASIFSIGSNAVFLDPETRTMIATGNPNTLLAECDNPTVRSFLTRGEETE